MSLSATVETLSLLGDESRLRLCLLLHERELRVTDLVRVTCLPQSRVSTHLGRLKEAGFVQDRREGQQSFYTLTLDAAPRAARIALEEALSDSDPTVTADRERLRELEAEQRGQLSDELLAGDIERDYSPGRSWRSLALGLAAGLEWNRVLDIGSGDGAVAACIAPYCRSLTCVDNSAAAVDAARARLARFDNACVQAADAQALPFEDESFDTALLFHTLTYAENPELCLRECARVLQPGGRAIILCLNAHQAQTVTRRYKERHPGFSPQSIEKLLKRAGLHVREATIACREARKPFLEVTLAVGQKLRSQAASQNNTRNS